MTRWCSVAGLLLTCAPVTPVAAQSTSDAPEASVEAAAASAQAARLFREAERLGRRVGRIRMVGARRATTVEKLNVWARTVFAPAIARRRAALEAARAAYERVIAVGPTPYAIASIRRVADLYLAFATEFERIPVPVEVRRDPELLRIYQGAIESAVAPMRETALSAFETCVRRADELGPSELADPHATRCREVLAAERPGPALAGPDLGTVATD